MTTKNVDSWSGDHLQKMMDYFKAIYGSSYTYYQDNGYDASNASGSTTCDLLDWWGNQAYTDSDRNLLIADANKWGEGGCAATPGHAAVVTILQSMVGMAGPSADPDLIGSSPGSGYTAASQVAAALQEVGHTYDAQHDQGIADSHDYVNYTSPMVASYADDKAGTDNQCGKTIEHNNLNQTRYVQGYSKCAVDASNFPHPPAKIYTKTDIESF